ncbi:MAG: prepilin-type N-terminal cleavage/methylation domain-containing protein [Bacillota bacterium]|jgi:prepilin-type N-terminal cleavage/methylation domain-containing protein
MPTSGTGKAASGFTLLEVLAVLVLIGLVVALVFPDFTRGAEKRRITLIGSLLQIDVGRVREEALAQRTDEMLIFGPDGYSFTIGGSKLRRVFKEFRVGLPNASESDQAGAAAVTFNAEGRCFPQQFHWETRYYQGVIALTGEGGVTWRCNAKIPAPGSK